ncbi:hypothetical protein MOB34_05380 [Bacillus spizizenii]|nr:hypothetical protein [Bacillus spizizenii]MCY8229622.1 hypothetical protein [Bacillus spizizenii]MCY8888079.1 hypothetical protein [Bacillus spizizenii]MEC0840223.1 hypothetical protein [Bacillus spizizenii]
MKLTVITFIDGDMEMALINESGNVLLSGDEYHDKIDDKIEGFFSGLDYAGFCYTRIEVEHEGSLYDSEYC